MLKQLLKVAACGSAGAAMAFAVGCKGDAANSQTSSGMTSQGGPLQSAMVNQGRYPAPAYSQEPQPAYALTGDTSDRSYWTPAGNEYQVGNARIVYPPAPERP